MAAGALAVAAVGLVAALQITAPPEAETFIDTVIATHDGRELPGGGTEGVRDGGDDVQPTDLVPSADTAYLKVDYADAAQPLTPRQPQNLTFTVENTGKAAATGAQMEVTLPSGLNATKPAGSFGTGVGTGKLVAATESPAVSATPTPAVTPTQGSTPETKADASEGSPSAKVETSPSASPSTSSTESPAESPVACMPTEQANVLLCSIGELAPGAARSVALSVQANAGGDYPVAAKVWADGLQALSADLPGRTVAPFGQELSAQTTDVSLASPGSASLPVTLGSTGDRPVTAGGWAMAVSLPEGVRPASTQSQLKCVAGEMPNAWLCKPLDAAYASSVSLEPGASVDVPLNITTATDAAKSAQPAELGVVNVRPVLVDGAARSSSATLVATSAWANASAGVGTVSATCLAEGGATKADAVVTGIYKNTTDRSVRVTLQAAGNSESTGKDVAPGESVGLTVHDGMRVPAGAAVFVLATSVDGNTYETRVPAGDHGSADCYKPGWDTDTSVQTVNAGGTVGMKGTITNRSNESMTAYMSVPVGDGTVKSVKLPVAPGGSVELSVNTERTSVPESNATFYLSREVPDVDGDLAAGPIVPASNPTARYGSGVIAPALGERTMGSTDCAYDPAKDRSVQTFQVTAVNTASNLDVKFHVGDVTRTVAAGATEVIEFPVVWGTDTVTVTAAGTSLGDVDVKFKSCAEVTWPSADQISVTTEAVCVEQDVQVEATVVNRSGRDWRGVLVHDGTGEQSEMQAVPAGGTVTFKLARQPLMSLDGNVTVRLARDLEGATRTVEQSYAVKGATCLLPEPICPPTQDPKPTPDAEPSAGTEPEGTGQTADTEQTAGTEQSAATEQATASSALVWTRTAMPAPTDSQWRRLMRLDDNGGCETPAADQSEQA